jgi:hypothetical protein
MQTAWGQAAGNSSRVSMSTIRDLFEHAENALGAFKAHDIRTCIINPKYQCLNSGFFSKNRESLNLDCAMTNQMDMQR